MIKKIYVLPLCLLCACASFAQAPGGINANLKLWIKSNAGTTVSGGGEVDSWDYANDGTKTFTGSGAARPILTPSRINFLPAVTFNSSMMDGPNGANAPIAAGKDDYCMFAVWRSTIVGFQRVWGQRDPSNLSANGFILATWNDQRYGDQIETLPFDQGMLGNYTVSQWNISHMNVLDQSTNDLEFRDQTNINGTPATATTVSGGSGGRSLSDVNNRLGARDNPGEEALNGDVAEVIVYDAAVTSAITRNQIYSYLAVKYGIPKAGDYMAADGTIFWDSTANNTYNNAVFGIGEDDASALLITQSNSMVTGSGDGTGQSGMANIVLSNPSGINDVSFLMIGNDNGSLTESGSEMPAAADPTAKRLPREWKVQHTNGLGTVDMSIDLNGITVTGTSALDFRLMVDEDGDADFTTGTIRYYKPVVFSGNILNFTGVTLNNGEIFTVVTSAVPITLPVTWKSVNAKVVNKDVVINWSVENNASGKNYEIEHSVDGASFTTAGVVNNDVNVKSYSFTHANVAGGQHFYRIHQVDVDGKATYSKIVEVALKAPDFVIGVLSNPVSNGYAEVNVNAAKAANATIELWSLNGTRITVLQQAINAGINRVKVAMDNIASGNYLIKVKVKDVVQTIKVAKL